MKTILEQTPLEEAIGCLVIFLTVLSIWGIGEIVYLIEMHKRNKK